MNLSKFKDHREIGRELELFLFDESSPGCVYWLPKGMVIFKTLEKFIRDILDKSGYEEISTPIIVKSDFFKKSGHWQFFKENMFNFKVEGESWSLKPMNCPEATVVYKFKTRSYRDLPLRFSEIGRLHRNELTGTLNGLFRTRQFVMDDAHIFCRIDQIQEEIAHILDIIITFYKNLNLPVTFGLATKPQKALGREADWQTAEEQLAQALHSHQIKFDTLKGEGAFYGPKIHVDFRDSLNRTWTMATIQVDFQIPERMDLVYVNEQGQGQRPVMIHRAILGTFERFIGILTEIYQGAFPTWLSPVQVIILPISEKYTNFAVQVNNLLVAAGLRCETDNRNETLSAKIRTATIQKIPYLLVIGEREAKEKKVAVRTREGKDLGCQSVDEFIKMISSEIENLQML